MYTFSFWFNFLINTTASATLSAHYCLSRFSCVTHGSKNKENAPLPWCFYIQTQSTTEISAASGQMSPTWPWHTLTDTAVIPGVALVSTKMLKDCNTYLQLMCWEITPTSQLLKDFHVFMLGGLLRVRSAINLLQKQMYVSLCSASSCCLQFTMKWGLKKTEKTDLRHLFQLWVPRFDVAIWLILS